MSVRFQISLLALWLVSVTPLMARAVTEGRGGIDLRIVYPQHRDTLNYDSVRFAGSVQPASHIWVQDDFTKVYDSGAFVGKVALQPGWNHITFEAAHAAVDAAIKTISIYRDPESMSFPASPTAIKSNEVEPARDVYVAARERLKVRFRGSPGGQAFFSLPDQGGLTEMLELPAEEARGVRGVYEGEAQISATSSGRALPITIFLQGRDGQTIRFRAPGRAIPIPHGTALVAMTTDSATFVFDKPGDGLRTLLPAGIKVKVINGAGDYTKVTLSRQEAGYIATGDLRFIPDFEPYDYGVVSGMTSQVDSAWLHLAFDVSERLPIEVRQELKPSAIELTFHRAVRSPHWDLRPPNDGSVQKVHFRQRRGDKLVLRLELSQKQQWGYRTEYVGNQLILSIRRPPAFVSSYEQPLSGFRICVDAGHGGMNRGALGATGLAEKDVNLAWSNLVAHMLSELGAHVISTRRGDMELTLDERIAVARQQDAHILISLHNNSINPDVDPLRATGTSVYFTTPQSEKLAEAIFENMSSLGLKATSCTTAPFRLTRETDVVACLVEGAFLTHPEDEMLLSDPVFLRQMARAVVDAVHEFVSTHL